MNTDMRIDAATVRRLRESRAWSQEQLAAVAGVSVRTVQRVEAEGCASAETSKGLAAAFDCLPMDLMKAPLPDPTEMIRAPRDEVERADVLARIEPRGGDRAKAAICATAMTVIAGSTLIGCLLSPVGGAAQCGGSVFAATLAWTVIVAYLAATIAMPGAWRWGSAQWASRSRGLSFGSALSAQALSGGAEDGNADARAQPRSPDRINTTIYATALSVIAIGGLFAVLLDPSKSGVFPTVFAWTVIVAYLVATATTPSAWRWAAKRWLSQSNPLALGASPSF